MAAEIEGIIVATLTPYTPDEALNPEAVARHVEFLVAGGIPAVAPAGTTGESLYLSEAERAAVVRETVAAARGRLKVIAGIWDLTSAGVGRLARAAEAAGADAVFLTPPIYYPAADEAIVQWYREVRRHTALPLFAYHIPQYAVNGVSVDAVLRLMDEGTIQGIKDSTGSAERVQSLLAATQGRIAVYGASDSFALQARRMGVDGFISALANIYPETFARIWAGDEAAQAAIDRVRTAVKGYGGIGGLKALLRARGHDFGPTRLPFGDLSPEAERQLAELVSSIEGLG